MATHSSTLAWEVPWTEEPGRLWRVRHDWATSLSLFTFTHWRRKWQPTSVFLPGESQRWEPGGLRSMGSHGVRHDWRDLAATAAAAESQSEKTVELCLTQNFSSFTWPWSPLFRWKVKVLVAQSCPTLFNLMDYGLSGSSVHGIFQAKILEWVAIPFSRGSSWSRNQTWVSHIAGRFFTCLSHH